MCKKHVKTMCSERWVWRFGQVAVADFVKPSPAGTTWAHRTSFWTRKMQNVSTSPNCVYIYHIFHIFSYFFLIYYNLLKNKDLHFWKPARAWEARAWMWGAFRRSSCTSHLCTEKPRCVVRSAVHCSHLFTLLLLAGQAFLCVTNVSLLPVF